MASPKGDIPKRVSAIEADLRALAVFAAKAGEWPVVRAASLAAENLESAMESKAVKSSAVPRAVRGRRSKPVGRGSSNGIGYPRFSCENGDLIKIGWSRREKAEYRHRAPEAAVRLVASSIAKLAASGGAFSSDDLFPIIDPQDGSDVPNYQGYLILRWMRELGLVEQDGRSEYSVPKHDRLVKAVEQGWKQLESESSTKKKESA